MRRLEPEQLFRIVAEECARLGYDSLILNRGVPRVLTVWENVCDRLNALGSCGHTILDEETGACGIPGCVNQHQRE